VENWCFFGGAFLLRNQSNKIKPTVVFFCLNRKETTELEGRKKLCSKILKSSTQPKYGIISSESMLKGICPCYYYSTAVKPTDNTDLAKCKVGEFLFKFFLHITITADYFPVIQTQN